jgi:hypothetical protein
MAQFPVLQTERFTATIADNSAGPEHQAGYNGVASLLPTGSDRSIFETARAGLGYEAISIVGLDDSAAGGGECEPRGHPMRVESADPIPVVLVQPETPHAHVSARIMFRVEPPHYLHQRVELTLHRRFQDPGHPYCFEARFASYLQAPTDRQVHLPPGGEGDGPLAYYGCPGESLLCLVMCKQPDRWRFADCEGDPAVWRHLLRADDYECDVPYIWDICLAVKEFAGQADVAEEVRRYQQM